MLNLSTKVKNIKIRFLTLIEKKAPSVTKPYFVTIRFAESY